MKVLIMPSVRCYRSCSYCYLQASGTSKRMAELVSLERFNEEKVRTPEEWMDGLSRINNIDSIDVSGGEPFVYPHFVELLKLIIKKYGVVSITSNLDLLPEEFFDLPKDKIWITVSYHMDDGEENKSILYKMERLRDAGFHFAINFVASPGQILFYDKIKKFGKLFGVPTHLEPYVDYNQTPIFFGIPNNLEEYEYMFENIRKDETEAMNLAQERGVENPKVINCSVAKSYCVVAENGDMYPCLGMMFENEECIGNLFAPFVFIFEKSIECDIFCPCAQNYRDGFK